MATSDAKQTAETLLVRLRAQSPYNWDLEDDAAIALIEADRAAVRAAVINECKTAIANAHTPKVVVLRSKDMNDGFQLGIAAALGCVCAVEDRGSHE